MVMLRLALLARVLKYKGAGSVSYRHTALCVTPGRVGASEPGSTSHKEPHHWRDRHGPCLTHSIGLYTILG